jgi:hypothetical protein
VFEQASGYENSLMLFFYLKSTSFPAYPVPKVSKYINFEPRKTKLALAPQSRRDANKKTWTEGIPLSKAKMNLTFNY